MQWADLTSHFIILLEGQATPLEESLRVEANTHLLSSPEFLTDKEKGCYRSAQEVDSSPTVRTVWVLPIEYLQSPDTHRY
jgi:hypothetical protein